MRRVPDGSVDATGPEGQTREAPEGQTREAVVRMLLEQGPVTAADIGARLGLSAAGVRRHLDALMEDGRARVAAARPTGGRGRPAKRFQLTAAGRARLEHSYDDLASAALRHILELGGEDAIEEFARRRVAAILGGLEPVDGDDPEAVERAAQAVADAFTAAGFAASTRRVGPGVQICQHHCPISHVAEQYPQLCEAEQTAFVELLGTHVQRLATIANGDSFCTTHIPLVPVGGESR